jgi:hypothetical protein
VIAAAYVIGAHMEPGVPVDADALRERVRETGQLGRRDSFFTRKFNAGVTALVFAGLLRPVEPGLVVLDLVTDPEDPT